MHKSKTEQQQREKRRLKIKSTAQRRERERKKSFLCYLGPPSGFRAHVYVFSEEKKNGWSLTLLLVARGLCRDGAAFAASRHALYR